MAHGCHARPAEPRLRSLAPPIGASRFKAHELADRAKVDRVLHNIREPIVTIDRCFSCTPAVVRPRALARSEMNEERPAKRIIPKQAMQIRPDHVAGRVGPPIEPLPTTAPSAND